MTTQPDRQASPFSHQIPRPSFASVRVEFTDGTVREFHVHKPLQADVSIPLPFYPGGAIDADLGALPVALVPPALPRVEVRIKAGISVSQQVITVDTRSESEASLTGRVLALLTEALDLREQQAGDDRGADDLWRTWEYKARAFLEGAR